MFRGKIITYCHQKCEYIDISLKIVRGNYLKEQKVDSAIYKYNNAMKIMETYK